MGTDRQGIVLTLVFICVWGQAGGVLTLMFMSVWDRLTEYLPSCSCLCGERLAGYLPSCSCLCGDGLVWYYPHVHNCVGTDSIYLIAVQFCVVLICVGLGGPGAYCLLIGAQFHWNFIILFPENTGGCSRPVLTGSRKLQLLCVHCSEPWRARCHLWSGWKDNLCA